MKKEEFPTFLNEQPTVIFGRTTRELLWIVCGIVSGYWIWNAMKHALPGNIGMGSGIVLGGAVGLALFVIALLPIGGRPLEEWTAVWLMYVLMPKLYLYKPAEEEMEYESSARERDEMAQQRLSKKAIDLDILEEEN